MKNLKTSLVLLSILALAVAAAASGALRAARSKASAARRPRLDGRDAHVARRTSGAASLEGRAAAHHARPAPRRARRSSRSRRPSAGYAGGADFNAVAKQLDANSVALSKAIASVYGAAAGEAVPERQEPLARAHQVLRRLHGRAREEGHRRPEEGRREPDDVHPDAGGVLRQGDGAAEAGARQRPDRARPAAQGSARRVRQGQLRAGVHAHGRCVQAHVHDGRPARGRDREAEGPRLDDEPGRQPRGHARPAARRARAARDVGDAGRAHRRQELPGAREAARQELRRDLEGDRLGLRSRRSEAVPERQEPLARAHQRLRRVHRGDGEEVERRPEEGRRRPDGVHPDAGGVLRQGDRPAEDGGRRTT